MLEDLFTAIYSKENASNTFKTAIGGRFYPHQATQGATYPFAVYILITDNPEYTFNTEMESAVIQIDIYDKAISAVTVLDAQKKLWALFDSTTLTISGYTHLLMERTGHRLTREEDPDVWRSSTDYLIIAHKN